MEKNLGIYPPKERFYMATENPRTQKQKRNRKGISAIFANLQARHAAKKALIASLTPKQMRKYKRRRKQIFKRAVWRTVLSLLTVIVLVLVSVLSAAFVLFRGPSQTFGDLLTKTLLETSALKFVPYIYYSDEQVEAIKARNAIVAPSEDTDTSLIHIDTGADEESQEEYKDIETFEVTGPTYKGVMMVVRDPSRVSVGVSSQDFSHSKPGLQLYEIAEKYGAVAAINGGAFEDAGGGGNGGMPVGVVVSDGNLLRKSSGSGDENVTVGFDQDNKLVVGVMTGSQAIERGIRDAVTFGPALVVNGEPVGVSGSGSGLNPRSAIGQRADGAVLMLVIDGRQVNSLGATLSDLIEIMLEYGAVNAANLDGGSSSLLYYEGEYLNRGVVLTGSRDIPTAFIVR